MGAIPSPEICEEHRGPGPEPDSLAEPGQLVLGLQYCRASSLALTRLQLALTSGDRRTALEAMDCLHSLDAEMERLVRRLPPVPVGHKGAGLASIDRHLGEQKMAIAFEKLAFASGVEGPDLVSQAETFPSQEQEPGTPAWPNLPDVEAENWNYFPARKLALLGAVILLIAVGAAAALLYLPLMP